MSFIPVMQSRTFSSHFSSLLCHVILQKSIFYADMVLKKHLLLLSMLKTFELYISRNLFVLLLFSEFCDERKSSKEQHLFEREHFWNTVNVLLLLINSVHRS